MREGTKEYVAEEQRGFSSGRGYVDKIFFVCKRRVLKVNTDIIKVVVLG